MQLDTAESGVKHSQIQNFKISKFQNINSSSSQASQQRRERTAISREETGLFYNQVRRRTVLVVPSGRTLGEQATPPKPPPSPTTTHNKQQQPRLFTAVVVLPSYVAFRHTLMQSYTRSVNKNSKRQGSQNPSFIFCLPQVQPLAINRGKRIARESPPPPRRGLSRRVFFSSSRSVHESGIMCCDGGLHYRAHPTMDMHDASCSPKRLIKARKPHPSIHPCRSDHYFSLEA